MSVSKFKSGDKLRVIDDFHSKLPIGTEIVVDKISFSGGIPLVHMEGIEGGWFESHFESSLTPQEEAIKLLEAEGYTITPPKPKLSGKKYIYRRKDNNIVSYDCEQYISPNSSTKLIAIVNWTEGDGLTSE